MEWDFLKKNSPVQIDVTESDERMAVTRLNENMKNITPIEHIV